MVGLRCVLHALGPTVKIQNTDIQRNDYSAARNSNNTLKSRGMAILISIKYVKLSTIYFVCGPVRTLLTNWSHDTTINLIQHLYVFLTEILVTWCILYIKWIWIYKLITRITIKLCTCVVYVNTHDQHTTCQLVTTKIVILVLYAAII